MRIDAITNRIVRRRIPTESLGGGNGAWVIPSDFLTAESICYCAGCGLDISFDLALIRKYGCRVWGIDPTPRAVEFVRRCTEGIPEYVLLTCGLWSKRDELKFFVPASPDHISHSAVNLQGTSSYFVAHVERLSDVMLSNNHTTLDLLKLDIEGAEYEVIKSIIEDELHIKILCVEFDESFHPLDKGARARISASIRELEDFGYALVDARGNGNYTFVLQQELKPSRNK